MFFIDFSYAKTAESVNKKVARFDLAKFVDYAGGYHEILTSYFITELLKLKVYGEYKVVAEEGRPDLISATVYKGDTQFWWILLAYNSIVSVDDIVNSMTIAYPSVSDIESLFYTLPGLSKQ